MTDILDLEGWNEKESWHDGNEQVILAEYTVPPTACTKCGVIGSLYKHGPKDITIRDIPLRAWPTRIIARAKRYKCRECGATFIQPLGGIHPDTRMTERLVEYIKSQCLKDTFVRIAHNVGCDDKTIRNIAGDYISQLNADFKPYLPDWVGIDETQIDGKLRCIITDVVNRVPIDMLPDRDKTLVTGWLYQFRTRTNVKGLAIDMWRPYKDAAQAVFPGLPVVIDKFHVVKMANKALEDIRISLAKDQTKAVGKDWMRRKNLLRMRRKNIDERGLLNLQMWLDNEPEIAVAHRLKEAFYDIYDAPTREEGGRLLDEWRASVPAHMKRGKKSFMPLLTATKNWREEILAFFDHPISNGYTEALNGVAKVINRSGRGYSFEVLRARLLFGKRQFERKPPMTFTQLPTPERVTVRVETVHYRSPRLRPMLLAKYECRCQSCKGIYEPHELYATRTGPEVSDDPLDNNTLLCALCKHRFHTEGVIGHESLSTH